MTVTRPSTQSPWSTPFWDAWRTVRPADKDRDGSLPPFLLGLTVVTGIVDAFSYLVLGHVFVANLTGNVVFLAFAIAGAPGFSIPASLLALGAFMVGAGIGGRFGGAWGADRGRLLARAALIESILVGVAALVTGAGDEGSELIRYSLIALLAATMGMQNATARRLAVPDLTTTVLTLTITGIAADGRFGAGGDAHVGRRTLAVFAMFAGALVGAILVLDGNVHWVLVLALVIVVAITAGARVASRPEQRDTGSDA